MTAAWERIDPGFRAYLEACGYSPAEYNNDSFRRAETFNAYNTFTQQQTTPPRGVDKRRFEEEETPGSKANPSRAALLSLVETIEET